MSVCLFVIVYLFVLLPHERALQCLSPSVSPVFLDSLTDFVMRAIVDDGALGDLLLDPASVRCRDEKECDERGLGDREKQMEDRAVHREMTKGEGESKGMESEDEGKERDEKEDYAGEQRRRQKKRM